MENKLIALLDSNVLSSLGSNGGSWQRRGALTWGIQLQCGEENVIFQLSHVEKHKADW